MGGKNLPGDLRVLQTLLNKHAAAGGYGRLKFTDKVHSNTVKAIEAFQRAIGIAGPDGRVDPGGKPLKAQEARELTQAEAPKGNTKAGKVTGSLAGVQSDIADSVKAVINALKKKWKAP